MEAAISRRQRQPKGRERIRGVERVQTIYAASGEISGIGVALALALVGVVLAWSTWIFELASESIASDAVLSFAIAFWFWGLLGLIIEFGEVRKFASGFNQEGWENLLITSAFLIPAGALLCGAWFSDLPVWLDLSFKFLAVVLGTVGALCVAATVDAFFIKPRINGQLKGQRAGSAPRDRAVLGSIGAFITWLLANTVNLLLIIDRLFSNT